jgi:hypothetical protein
MKRYLLGIVALLFAATFVFAFSAKKHVPMTTESKMVSQVIYQYIGPEPPSSSDITNTSNWVLVTVDPCDHLGTKLCSITFDTNDYTLAQALALIGAPPFTDGQNVGTASKPVIISTKS